MVLPFRAGKSRGKGGLLWGEDPRAGLGVVSFERPIEGQMEMSLTELMSFRVEQL